MQLPWENVLSYMNHDPRWFEDFSRRAPSGEHLRAYQTVVPDTWRTWRRGYWVIAEPPGAAVVGEGWKLHVSATSRTSVETLRRSLPVLRDAGVRFKFLMDPMAVREANGKSFPRASSGKFITVYPEDDTRFLALASELTDALKELDGPYVLSDRRCPGSRVVSYRYGGFISRFELEPLGLRDLMIQTPDGSLVQDLRTPFWYAPSWARDPYADAEPVAPRAKATGSTSGGGQGLLHGRFKVESALAFSNRGGIYRGVDTETGADVVLREARPGVEVGPEGIDAVELLRHEYELLTELTDTGLFVRPVTFFEQWEHAFIAEDHIDGGHLGHLSVTHNPLYGLDLTPARLTDYYDRFRLLWLQVADAIAACHERGIVLGDLSPTNIMVTADDRIRVIDLESAFHEDRGGGAGLGTPGAVTRRAMAAGRGDRRSDYYALGGIMLCCVLTCQQNDLVDHAVPLRLLDAVAADLALPGELVTLIRELYDEDAPLPDPATLRQRLTELPFSTAWRELPPLARRVTPDPESSAGLHGRIATTLDGVAKYLRDTADLQREDRLFPADVLVFETNPLSVAHGAYGCLYALHTTGEAVPDTFLAWALRKPTGHKSLPPGLYYGSAGVAWVLSALGHRDVAVRVLRDAAEHPLLYAEPGVLTGAAGHGMACLRLWRDTGLAEFLDRAREIGEHFARTARHEGGRAHWPGSGKHVPVGYGEGASGVAMFLLALHAATGDPALLELGRAGLEFDLSCGTYAPSGLLSFPAVADPDEPIAVLRHYWDEGTAGILTTLLRYHHVTGDEALGKHIEELLPDVRRKYATFPQLFHGISGLGNVLLDAYEFLGDPELLGDAERAAEAVLCSAVRRPEGVVFPGEQTVRESCDLATGSAGVALFLDRFRRTGPGARTNTNFLLDDLLTPPRTDT
ncbi:class III lanthionine synthetase LanKC [Streptomyces sp. NBC_00989]|uniref:class III lanthionine synthetase LanKC n=1 Tax=Streptomyces sp. NBC_00989 TaxID=2903705 RepID=UPI00386334F3|nr:class III lanthionine synthetase LanKC [Streptomyces sp. NBC_00989]